MSRYTIPKIGARVIEGRANGLSIPRLCWALAKPPASTGTLDYHLSLAQEELGLGPARDRAATAECTQVLRVGQSVSV